MSEHARYRGRLDRLAAVEMATTVTHVAGERGWVEPGTAARRTFGRFWPGAAPWATLVFELDRTHVRVDAFDDRDGEGAVPADAIADAAGPLRFTRVADDGAVTGLPAVLRAYPGAAIVRYRPGRRCVLRVGDRFVKLMSPELGIRVHDAARRLWTAHTAGRLPFRVAEPDRWDAEHSALWQGVVAGGPAAPAMSTSRGPAIAGLVGVSLGALATGPVEPWHHWSGEEQWARTERAAAHVVRRVPEVDDEVADVVTRLRHLVDRFAPRAPVPVHGAASVDQWLDDGSTLGLVDFDRFGWGDPELDAAAFLGAIDFDDAVRGSRDEIEGALLAGLRQTGFAPDARRLAAYRVAARLRKVARTAMAVRPDGDERTARHLRTVVEALGVAESQPRRG